MRDLSILADGLPARRGAVGLLSGDEFTPHAAAFDRALLDACRGPKVGLVICADHANRATTARNARAHLGSLDAELIDADVIHGDEHPEVDLVYLAGGSPSELLGCLRDDARWQRVMQAWQAGTALAGASAGAMALCEHALEPDEGASVPTRWARGLGPVARAALAVHASSRPSEWLAEITRTAPVPVLALDDYTGVVIHPDGGIEPVGPGNVWFA